MRQSAGFTLIEMVVTIVVSAIIAVGLTTYIANAIEGYAAAGSRNKLATSGRTIVDRIAMELHNAVPNSVRVTAAQPGGNQCLEFVPFRAASSYTDAPFTGGGGHQVSAVDFNPQLTLASPAEVYAIIYPISISDLYSGGSPGPRAEVDDIVDTNGGDGLVSLNLTGNHRFSRRSPVNRIYVADQPVSFCIVGSNLFRYHNYDFQTTQCTPSTPSCLPTTAPERVLVTQLLDNQGITAFRVIDATLRRNAMIAMDMNFADEDDTVRLEHEVLLRNVP